MTALPSGPGSKGTCTMLYNKLLTTELLRAPEASGESGVCVQEPKAFGTLNSLARRKLLSGTAYSSSRLSPAGKELINQENNEIHVFSTRPTNVLTARGILVRISCYCGVES